VNKHVLFVQGGGDGGFEEDARLASSLQTELGDTYKVLYPEMPSDDSLPDFGWLQQIRNEITAIKGEVILVGHSLGASMLLKYLSEKDVKNKISGIFLIATPFWSAA
jgi:predicted alpha/beta hydrolase family esterase